MVFLSLAGMLGGFVNPIAGGGAFLTLPALFAAGPSIRAALFVHYQ